MEATVDRQERIDKERARLSKKYGLNPSGITADYLAGKIEWEEANGTLKTRLTNYQRFLLLSLIGNILLAGGIIHSSQQTHVVPYVAAVDKLGNVQSLGVAVKGPDSVTEVIKEQQLDEWIRNARMVISDWQAQRLLIQQVMSRTSDNPAGASGLMKAWYTANRPDERAKNSTVTVTINNTLRVSLQTYEVEWTETSFNTDGEKSGEEHWKGVFRVAITPAATADAAGRNPLGFYVTEIHWSKVQ